MSAGTFTGWYRRRCSGCLPSTPLREHVCRAGYGVQWCECPCGTEEQTHRESWAAQRAQEMFENPDE